MIRIAVIIPFYQREAGILRRALASVAAQDLPELAQLTVFVVDDDSPVPAAEEVAHLPDRNLDLRLLAQPNGGPGAARNLALEAVAQDAFTYVAFLDSDDIWEPQHLRDALARLEAGQDFYFCNHRRTDEEDSYFQSTPALHQLRKDRSAGVTVIDSSVPVLGFDRVTLLPASVRTYLSQTSTVVVRQRFVQDLRFDPALRNAGEDQLFWLSLIAAGARSVVSWRCNVLCGNGVNIYFDAFDWGSAKVVDRTGYVLMFFHTVRRRLDLAPQDRHILAGMIRRYRRAYSFLFLRALLLGKKPNLSLTWKLAAHDPALIPRMPLRFLAVWPNRRSESADW